MWGAAEIAAQRDRLGSSVEPRTGNFFIFFYFSFISFSGALYFCFFFFVLFCGGISSLFLCFDFSV